MSLNTLVNKEIYKKYPKDSKTESEINSLKNTGKQEKSLIRQLSVNLKNLALKRSAAQGESAISAEKPSLNEDRRIEYIGFTPKQYKGGSYRPEMQLNMGTAEADAVFKLGSRAFKLKNRNPKLGDKTPKDGDSCDNGTENTEFLIKKADLVVKKNDLIPPLLHFLNYNMFAMRTPWRYLSKEKTLRNNVEELLLFLKLFQKLTTKYYKDIDLSGKTTREREFEFLVNFYNYVYTKINILFKQMTYNEIVNTVLDDKEKKISESDIDVNFLIGYKDVVCINNKYYDIKDFGLDTSYINYQKYVVFDLCDDKYSLSDLFNKEFNDQIVELRMNEHYIPSFGYILTVCSAMLFWIKFDTLDKFCVVNYTNINFNILLVFSCLILTMDQSISNISEVQDRLLNTLRWREYCGPAAEECNSNVPLMFPITTWPPSYKRYLYYYYNVIKRVRNSDLYSTEGENLIEELESEEMNYVAGKDNLKVAEIKSYKLESVVLVNSLIPKHSIDIEIYQLNGNTGTYDITDLTSRSVTTDGYSSLSGSAEQMLTVRSIDSNAGKVTVDQILGKSAYGGKSPSSDSILSQGIVSPLTGSASRLYGTVNPATSGVNVKASPTAGHANRAAAIHANVTGSRAASPLGADAEVSSGTSYATCSPGELGPNYDSDNLVSPVNEWVNNRCKSYDSIMFRNCKCSYYNHSDSNDEVKLLSCPYNYTTKTIINSEYDDNVIYYFNKDHRDDEKKEHRKNGVGGSQGNSAGGGYSSVYGTYGNKGAYSYQSEKKNTSGASHYHDDGDEGNVVLTGDITIVFVVDIKHLGRNHVASYSFNTSFIDGNVIELKKEDLDIWDKKCPILPNSRIVINLTQLNKEVCERLVSKESIGSEIVMGSTTEEGWYIFSKSGNVMNFVVNHIKKVKFNELQQLLRLTKHKIETCLLALKLCKSFAEALTLLIQLKKPFHQNYFNKDEANEFYKENFDEDLETPKKFDKIEYSIDGTLDSKEGSPVLEKIEEAEKIDDDQEKSRTELEGEREKEGDSEKKKGVEEDDKTDTEELNRSAEGKKGEDEKVDEDEVDRFKSIKNFRRSEQTPLLSSSDDGFLASDGEMLEGSSSSSSSRTEMEMDDEESKGLISGNLVAAGDDVLLRINEGSNLVQGEKLMHLLKNKDAILGKKEDGLADEPKGPGEDKYGLSVSDESTLLGSGKDRLSDEEAAKLFSELKNEDLVTLLEYANENKLLSISAESVLKDKKSQLSRSELLSRLNDENLIKLLTYKEDYTAMRDLVDKDKLEEFDRRVSKGEDVESLLKGKSAVYEKVERMGAQKPVSPLLGTSQSDGEGRGKNEDAKSSVSAENQVLSSDGMSMSDKSDLGGFPSPKEVLLTTRLDISLSPISTAVPAKSGPLLVPPLILGKAPSDPPVKQKVPEKQEEKPVTKQPMGKQVPKGKMPPKLGKKAPPLPKGPIKSVKRALPLGVKLHWKPLLPNKLNNTIFASFNDNPLMRSNTTQSDLIDVTNIKKLFSRSSHASNSISTLNSRAMVEVPERQNSNKRKKTSNLIEVLDNKRAQNILIILRFNSMDEYIKLLDDVNNLSILNPVLTYFCTVNAGAEGGMGSASSRTSSIGSMFGLSTGSFGSIASSETVDTNGLENGGTVGATAQANHVVSSTGTASIINVPAPVNEKVIDEIKDNINKLHLSYPNEHEIELLVNSYNGIDVNALRASANKAVVNTDVVHCVSGTNVDTANVGTGKVDTGKDNTGKVDTANVVAASVNTMVDVTPGIVADSTSGIGTAGNSTGSSSKDGDTTSCGLATGDNAVNSSTETMATETLASDAMAIDSSSNNTNRMVTGTSSSEDKDVKTSESNAQKELAKEVEQVDDNTLKLRQFRDIERMLIEMLLRDRMWVKINMVKYYIDMEHQLMVINQQLKLYSNAISEVKNSRLLPLILNIILQYGNFVNYGNINEGEKGFTLSSTIKLIDFKSSDNTLSSLHYLIINLYIKLLTSATASASPSSAENTPVASSNPEVNVAAVANNIASNTPIAADDFDEDEGDPVEPTTSKPVGSPVEPTTSIPASSPVEPRSSIPVGTQLPDPDDALGGNLLNIDKKLINVLKAQKISSRGINETLQELSNQLLEIITMFDRSSATMSASFTNDMNSVSGGHANSLNNTDRSNSSVSSSGSSADDKMNALISMSKKRLNEINEHKDQIFTELKNIWYYLGEDFGANNPDKTELGAENELEKIFKILGELIMCIKKVFSDVKVKPTKYLIVLSKPEDQELFLKSFMDTRSRTNYYKSLKR
ncbi:hypothetical protein MACK_002215 [Theileria orientalis]|uniref:C2 tensin-type domain-containing protein n=1 Tax=Theileria orientalis TaxID=68886 RepID=A0A976QV62_THEOR|nr:hypothetical protein MACK_002215 [Theileria orientalis]